MQRYLLADEVGLGKTVEAGLVIRQYVLDSEHDRPETYDAWFATAQQLLPTLPAPAPSLEVSSA